MTHRSNRFTGLLLASALAVISTSAAAQPQGDAQAGKIKAYTCLGCHGIPSYVMVYPTFHVPRLGGQHEQYIIDALKAYRDGKRSFPTMEAQARSLSEQDMADIAAYFSGLDSKN